MKDFFISYNKADKSWAEWIAWTLEESGYSVTIQAWDFRPGCNFVLEMQQAAADANQTIAVMSHTYLEAAFTKPEWAAALAQDPQGKHRKLVPVRVAECKPMGILEPICYVDLVELQETEARVTLLEAFAERAKPKSAPTFPGGPTRGAIHVSSTQPVYPGVTGATSTAPASILSRVRTTNRERKVAVSGLAGLSNGGQVPNIFKGDGLPHKAIENLPDAPRPRQFSKQTMVELGGRYRPSTDEIQAVNNALLLRRPLLITGEPGKGKASLAYAVAHELQLGSVLVWPITSRTTLQQGLYHYDSIMHLQEASLTRGVSSEEPKIELFLQLGPLGTALIDSREKHPRVLLIDEIDRCDIDLLHDLIHVFEEGEVQIPELARLAYDNAQIRLYQSEENCLITRGRLQCKAFPLVFLTSDGEREFPPAFIRFCLRLHIPVQNVSDEIPKDADSALERLRFFRRLTALAPQQFNELIFAVNPPAGQIPPMPAAQSDRVSALLDWAERPGGRSLSVLQHLLETILNPQ
jgi:hypothetical protein